MNPNIDKLHANIEFLASCCIIAGLIAMQLNHPSIYTQWGIVFWGAAQTILLCWWSKRVSSAHAAMLMGVLNIAGAVSFFIGCYVGDVRLGMFISCCYTLSSSMQFISGWVRIGQNDATRLKRLLRKLLARRILIFVSALQALAAMCFILLLPIAGMLYTVAAFMALGINLLLLQLELQQVDVTQAAAAKVQQGGTR